MQTLSRKVWSRPDYLLAFGFGTGLVPKAPGTAGTLVAIPVYLLLQSLSLNLYLPLVMGLFLRFALQKRLPHPEAG